MNCLTNASRQSSGSGVVAEARRHGDHAGGVGGRRGDHAGAERGRRLAAESLGGQAEFRSDPIESQEAPPRLGKTHSSELPNRTAGTAYIWQGAAAEVKRIT